MVADAPPNRRGGFLLRWSPREERRAPTHGSRNGVKWFSDDKAVAFIVWMRVQKTSSCTAAG